MCGIIGAFHYGTSKPLEQSVLKRMCDTIVHRGPDSEGFYLDMPAAAHAGLGIRRLAIIDLQTGNQPIHNEDKTVWVVLNGEIYNFQELREELKNKHTFSTKSDTEVIVHLYEEYGEKCVDRLRGMFAFALWDTKKKQLFIAKDRLGKKPLYYTSAGGAFVFGSELKTILAYLQHTPETDREAIDLYLTYQYIPSPHTIFKGIYSLPPAHTLVCTAKGDVRTQRYWDLDFTKKTDLSFSDACIRAKELLTEATKLRMISDVPLGAFLSGGHDSSIIAGLMSTLSPTPVKTFSIGFEEAEFSELGYARIAARRYHTDHHEFIVKPDFIHLLPKLAWFYGQPYADTSALPSYYVSHETRKHVTVALNGDGGDEAFGGYLRYKAMKGSLFFSLPFRLMGRRFTDACVNLLPHNETANNSRTFRYIHRLVSGLAEPPESRNTRWSSFFTQEAKSTLYTDAFRNGLANDPTEYQISVFRNALADTVMDRTFSTDIHTYLPECLLVKMDIASMANSLEARSPFLDHKVMEFSASLPASWKVRGLTTKYILKKAFADFLPPEILNRGKMGFGIPVGKWFRNDWKEYFRETVLSPEAVKRGYFRQESLERLFQEHVEGKRDHGYRMWALLMLELWHRVYVDKTLKP